MAAQPPGSGIAGVLLAGGGSTRMGRPKATLAIGGETFVARIARRLAAAGCAPLVVVAGEHASETFAALDAVATADAKTVRLVNPDPRRGQLSSLKIALEWLLANQPKAAAALAALVDHPAVRASTYAALHAAPTEPPSRAIVVPTWKGRRGHPVRFARSVWEELIATPDDQGARAVVHADPERVLELPVDDPGIHRDVDTPADLAKLSGDPGAG